MQVKLLTLLCKVPEATVVVSGVKPVGGGVCVLDAQLMIDGNLEELLEVRLPVQCNSSFLEASAAPSKKVNSAEISLTELIPLVVPCTATITYISLELMDITGWSVVEFTCDSIPGEKFQVVTYHGLKDLIGTPGNLENRPLRRKLK